jgi:glucose-specific phosphotransferase system IIA component
MLFKKKPVEIRAPINGKLTHLENVNDQVFSQKMLGDGIAIHPSDGKVSSPISGEVVMIQNSKHAIGIKHESGLEILIHIGIDTVKLEGEGFVSNKKVGDKVEVGDELIEFDKSNIEDTGFDATVIVIAIDSPKISNVELSDANEVEVGKSNIMSVIFK